MVSEIAEFVMQHPLFSHHDHHIPFNTFEENRSQYDATALLGYAPADIVTAAGPGAGELPEGKALLAEYWPRICTTGYGQAVTLGCQALFGTEYSAENFESITDALQSALGDRSPSDVYDFFVREKANIPWVVQDSHFAPCEADLLASGLYPEYYRFAWRLDELFSITDAAPIEMLEAATGMAVLTLDQLVEAMNANIDSYTETGKLAAFKIGIAYRRDLVVGDPSTHEAERVFNAIRNLKSFDHGIQQNTGAVNALEARALADYLIHRLLSHASDTCLREVPTGSF